MKDRELLLEEAKMEVVQAIVMEVVAAESQGTLDVGLDSAGD